MARSTSEYSRKRNFAITAEPRDDGSPARRKAKGGASFVIQKHDARRLHYDFRLELDGTLKSWAVPKGPSLDPGEKRLAVQVEDHPLAYGSFEGSIPEGQYGAGDVIVWDRGEWQAEGDATAAYAAGKLKFELRGEKLHGHWTLVRTRLKGNGDKTQWLLIKERDDEARDSADYEVTVAEPDSVLSDKTLPRLDTGRRTQTVAKPETTQVPARKRTAKARKAKPPDSLDAQLATLVDSPPAGNWLYEVKYDGYRLLARIVDGEVHLFTRSGNDWTTRLPEQGQALAALGLENAWLDGEIVVTDERGVSRFQALQNAFETGKASRIHYYLFDVPYLNGADLRELPLEQRRELLGTLLEERNDSDLLRFSEAFEVPADRILASACELGLEGVIGKRLGSPYRSRRNKDWIKLKCAHRQEFVIIGYTPPKGGRQHLGALLVALHDDQGRLRYAGKVGTGFTAATLAELHARFQPLIVAKPPVANPPRGAAYRQVTWLKPEQLCEIAYAELTEDLIVRQGVFHGLRDDKPAREIGLERAQPAQAAERPTASARRKSAGRQQDAEVAGVRISHPQRVIDEASGASKLDVARYYAAVADWLLPHLANRPVALVRTPDGIAGEQIFQKHKQTLAIPHIRELDPALDPGHAPLMAIDSRDALVGAAQMGTVELHTWNATADRIERPDRFILDLDPDPKLPWARLLEATHLVLTLLDELDLQAFVKTSGGRGLHLVVPLERRHDWDTVKAFAQAAAQHLANTLPKVFVAKMGEQNRQGRIFVDYLRNRHGATTVSAFSLRARPHLGVSVPIARAELERLERSDQWHFDTLLARIEGLKDDPWAGYAGVRQSLTATRRKRLGVG
ncbi:DNA ligase D [Pseudomonas sp. EpS/L25]|uniref:DNA ligase D n=1 Tax=Pseudomonas sp. EpS/L25 TaxID=1749078 RepID=UPI000743529C|nr:DNA ligase D [Pseudomonas sp. EpS/L25]KUM42933.1 ATP-dependent DNA ligase [Pseudomonas sp. EpS/L25]